MEWTEQRIETLRKLWGQGQTASQIAAILGGITRNAVIGKAHRLGLTGRPSPIKREAGGNASPSRRKANTTRTERPARPAVMPNNGQQAAGASMHSGAVHAANPSPAQGSAQARPSAPATAPASASLPPVATNPQPSRAHSGNKSCSWPVGDPKQPGFHFCGEPAEIGRPYCANHCHVAYHRKSEAA
jgi:GcrA cell cycle regulator